MIVTQEREPSPPPSWEERAAQVRELQGVLAQHLAGSLDRDQVQAWTRAFQDRVGYGNAFRGHGPASLAFASLRGVKQRIDGEYVLRRTDIERHHHRLTTGRVRAPYEVAFVLEGEVPEFLTGTSITEERYWLDGLGWQEGAEVVSPATGVLFGVTGPLNSASPIASAGRVEIYLPLEPDFLGNAQDAAETLAIDARRLLYVREDLGSIDWPRWAVVRQDDHGTRYDVCLSISHSHARVEVARFEAMSHKQTYWVEERAACPLPGERFAARRAAPP